ADQLIVIDAVELEAPIGLKRRVVAPNPVDARDQVREASWIPTMPAAHLILFRIEVLLAAGLARAVLEQLERGPIDAEARGERWGEHEPAHEGRAPAVLQVLVQDSRRVRPEVRPEILP